MKIIGTGSAHPTCKVTNTMLEQFLETSDEWITERTGIKERLVISSEKLEDLAVTINTGNVVPIIGQPGSNNRLQSDNPYLNGSKITWDNMPVKFETHSNIYEDMQNRIDELEKENDEYKIKLCLQVRFR